MKLHLLTLALAASGFSASLSIAKPRPVVQHRAQSCLPSALSLSREVATLLKQNNTSALSRYVDPEWGLRISPEVYVSKDDVKFGSTSVALLSTNKKARVWGTYDGSGEPILLNWANYRKRFVWPRDFTTDRGVTVNGTPRGTSNTINNLREFYPKDILVEFYLPPTTRDGMDWASLWLIWRPTGKTWRLIGIAHNEWTI